MLCNRRAEEMFGYRPLTCAGGEEALQLSRTYNSKIHLLLTDVVMPLMSGPQLAAEVAGSRPDMKVLYLSGYTETAAVQHGIVDASVNFLAKPFSRDALRKALREILEVR